MDAVVLRTAVAPMAKRKHSTKNVFNMMSKIDAWCPAVVCPALFKYWRIGISLTAKEHHAVSVIQEADLVGIEYEHSFVALCSRASASHSRAHLVFDWLQRILAEVQHET
jgi:hypothetical protein